MPGCGRQVAREVTFRHPAIEVVFMSGYSNETLGSRGILDPGMTLLAKPFNGPASDHCLAQVLGEPVKAAPVSAPTMH